MWVSRGGPPEPTEELQGLAGAPSAPESEYWFVDGAGETESLSGLAGAPGTAYEY